MVENWKLQCSVAGRHRGVRQPGGLVLAAMMRCMALISFCTERVMSRGRIACVLSGPEPFNQILGWTCIIVYGMCTCKIPIQQPGLRALVIDDLCNLSLYRRGNH